MKAEELRIGNYVNILGKNKKVLGMNRLNPDYKPYDRVYIEFDGLKPMKEIHLKPIPITEQWLLDFGFKIQGEFYEKWEGNLLYSYCTDNGFCFGQEMEFSYDIKVKHVHSLQNLFFALTGKELTLK